MHILSRTKSKNVFQNRKKPEKMRTWGYQKLLRNLNSVKHDIKASKYTHTLLCYSYILKFL